MFKLKSYCLLIFMLVFVSNCDYGKCEINMTEYNQMPKIYALDDYDRCMEEFPDQTSTYCFVDITIAPNASNSIWNLIEKYSADDKHFFRHDRLRRGICLDWCRNQLDKYEYDNETLKSEFYQELDFDRRIEYITFQIDKGFRQTPEYRMRYAELMNECINHELKNGFDLKAYSEIEYCKTNQDPFEVDFLDIFFILYFLCGCGLVGLSTLYDYRLKTQLPKDESEEHYKVALEKRKHQFFTAFSLQRNWYKLIEKTTDDEVKSMHCVRFLLECFLIVVHTLFVFNIFPSENPQWMENQYFNIPSMFILNGLTVIQTYFLINGIFLGYQFYQHKSSKMEFDGTYFWKKLFYKLFAIIPIYAFVILLHSTWLQLLEEGPVSHHFNEPERYFCRKYWYLNLLFLNSYIKPHEPCVQQGWFLGSDVQLYILSLLCLMALWKYPKISRILIGFVVILAYVIPGLVTYLMNFEGIIMLIPESQKYVLWYNKYYLQIYIPSHTNIGSYLTGIIGGWCYYQFKKKNTSLKEYKLFVGTFWIVLPSLAVLILSGSLFYHYDFMKPSLWIAVYASLTRNLWVILVTVLIVGCGTGVGWVVKNFINFAIFRPLGRVSLSVYLIHTFVLRVTLGSMRQPSFLSYINITSACAATMVLSYGLAAGLWLTIEQPFATVIRVIFNDIKRPIKQNGTELNNGHRKGLNGKDNPAYAMDFNVRL